MTKFQPKPNADGLVKLSGTIRNLKSTRASASFLFTESDQTKMGVVAVAAAIAGLGGQAMAAASNASAMEEEADYLEFDLDGQPVKGWVWRNPFKEGDEVSVAAERRADGHWEAFGVQRPVDQTMALYPHCSRGRMQHFKNAARLWFFGLGTATVIILALLYAFLIDLSQPFNLDFLYVFGGTMVFYAIMTFSLSRKWMPFVRLAEKVFCTLGLPNPSYVDLVKNTRRLRQEHDDVELGIFYFRYALPGDSPAKIDSIISIQGEISQLSVRLEFDVAAYINLLELERGNKRKMSGNSEIVRRDSLPEAVSEKYFPPSATEMAAHHAHVDFKIGKIPFTGRLWRNPFSNGDFVVVAAEREGAKYRILGIARPNDRIIALYPQCTGSKISNLWPTLFSVAKVWMAAFGLIGVAATFSTDIADLPRVLFVAFVLTFLPAAGFHYVFVYLDHLRPVAMYAKRVLLALEVPNPSSLDLIRSSKENKMGGDSSEYGVFYFRY